MSRLISVLHRRKRKKKKQNKLLCGCPQKRAICTKLIIKTPRKPNSAKRKVAKIRLSTRKFTFGYIPGEGHSLQKFSQVVVRGGRIPDLPGVHYTIIRNLLDFRGIPDRRSCRSKYGTQIWWKPRPKIKRLTIFEKVKPVRRVRLNGRRDLKKLNLARKYVWQNFHLKLRYQYSEAAEQANLLFDKFVNMVYARHKKTVADRIAALKKKLGFGVFSQFK